MHRYHIRENTHRSGFRVRPFLCRPEGFDITFAIHPYSETNGSDHINKLFGMTFGLPAWNGKEFVHTDSYRIGWRVKGTAVELFEYVRRDGKLITKPLKTVESGSMERIKVYFDSALHTDVKSWGYLNFPYYGGVPKAPDDIVIDLEYKILR